MFPDNGSIKAVKRSVEQDALPSAKAAKLDEQDQSGDGLSLEESLEDLMDRMYEDDPSSSNPSSSTRPPVAKTTIVPKGADKPIKQTMVNIFQAKVKPSTQDAEKAQPDEKMHDVTSAPTSAVEVEPNKKQTIEETEPTITLLPQDESFVEQCKTTSVADQVDQHHDHDDADAVRLHSQQSVVNDGQPPASQTADASPTVRPTTKESPSIKTVPTTAAAESGPSMKESVPPSNTSPPPDVFMPDVTNEKETDSKILSSKVDAVDGTNEAASKVDAFAAKMVSSKVDVVDGTNEEEAASKVDTFASKIVSSKVDGTNEKEAASKVDASIDTDESALKVDGSNLEVDDGNEEGMAVPSMAMVTVPSQPQAPEVAPTEPGMTEPLTLDQAVQLAKAHNNFALFDEYHRMCYELTRDDWAFGDAKISEPSQDMLAFNAYLIDSDMNPIEYTIDGKRFGSLLISEMTSDEDITMLIEQAKAHKKFPTFEKDFLFPTRDKKMFVFGKKEPVVDLNQFNLWLEGNGFKPLQMNASDEAPQDDEMMDGNAENESSSSDEVACSYEKIAYPPAPTCDHPSIKHLLKSAAKA